MRKPAATTIVLIALAQVPAHAVVPATSSSAAPDAFLAALSGLCGKAFAGRIVANEPAAAPGSPPDPFEGKSLVMHVRECTAGEIRVPFHVGDDHSRTWVITRTGNGLRLKHDHRHEDGSPDVLTMYGGDTATPGTAVRQEFPVDAESKALFERQGLKASLTNVWTIELEPGRRYVYELARPGRLFRVEFDLAKPVALPPPPWGSTTAP
ncbi:MAG: hypothetical protein MUF57_09295 [Gammaproteobacteria bacterium]|jgi:hypothetical protein|nr:hypothetical protein [Gammaproteobacteria bacterium]